jgi:hypothetical protein
MIIQLWPCQYILRKQTFGRNGNANCSTYFKELLLHTFDYPYPKAVSSAEDQGMEYPMICWNYGSG